MANTLEKNYLKWSLKTLLIIRKRSAFGGEYRNDVMFISRKSLEEKRLQRRRSSNTKEKLANARTALEKSRARIQTVKEKLTAKQADITDTVAERARIQSELKRYRFFPMHFLGGSSYWTVAENELYVCRSTEDVDLWLDLWR